jgi:hypothetical protein
MESYPKYLERTSQKEGIEDHLAYQSESYGKFRVDTAYNYVFDFKATRNNYHAEARADKFVNLISIKLRWIKAISPLSPKAFHYYDFKWIGNAFLAGKEADWFEIIPKRNNDEKVFSGKIALSKDEGWIVGLDVSVNHYAIQYHFEIDFESIQSVVLPLKYQISTTGKLMGFQGEYQYVAHVWNYQLGNIEPIKRPAEHQFREVYNIQERNFEVQQFKQVMGTLGLISKILGAMLILGQA